MLAVIAVAIIIAVCLVTAAYIRKQRP
jgi:hypothetical protein